MKKVISIMVIAILVAGTICAQDKVNPRENRQRETVSIEGTLKLENGLVAVQSGDTVYRVPLLNRYIGFINGLKEGAKVSVEGNSFRNVIMPKKVVIDDKTYDFVANFPPRNNVEPRNQNPERRNLAPGKNMAPGRNMVPRNMGPGKNFGPGKNMTPGRNMFPKNMGPGHQNFPGQRPNPRG